MVEKKLNIKIEYEGKMKMAKTVPKSIDGLISLFQEKFHEDAEANVAFTYIEPDGEDVICVDCDSDVESAIELFEEAAKPSIKFTAILDKKSKFKGKGKGKAPKPMTTPKSYTAPTAIQVEPKEPKEEIIHMEDINENETEKSSPISGFVEISKSEILESSESLARPIPVSSQPEALEHKSVSMENVSDKIPVIPVIPVIPPPEVLLPPEPPKPEVMIEEEKEEERMPMEMPMGIPQPQPIPEEAKGEEVVRIAPPEAPKYYEEPERYMIPDQPLLDPVVPMAQSPNVVPAVPAVPVPIIPVPVPPEHRPYAPMEEYEYPPPPIYSENQNLFGEAVNPPREEIESSNSSLAIGGVPQERPMVQAPLDLMAPQHRPPGGDPYPHNPSNPPPPPDPWIQGAPNPPHPPETSQKYQLISQVLREVRPSLQPSDFEMARIEGSNRIQQTAGPESYIFSTITIWNKHFTAWPQNVTLQKVRGSLYIETTVIPTGPLPGCKLEFTLPIMTPKQPGVYHAMLRFKTGGREFGEKIKIWLNVQLGVVHPDEGKILEAKVERAALELYNQGFANYTKCMEASQKAKGDQTLAANYLFN